MGSLRIWPSRMKPRIYRQTAGVLMWRQIEWGPFVWSGSVTRRDTQSFKAQSQPESVPSEEQGNE